MANDNTIQVKEVRDRPDAELVSLREAKLEEYHKAKFKHELGQLRETHRLGQLKRDIAKLSTLLAARANRQAQHAVGRAGQSPSSAPAGSAGQEQASQAG